MWEPDKDGNDKNSAMVMKDLTLSALQRHKQKAKCDDKDCRLDYDSQLSVLPQTDAMWGYLWGHAENEIRKAIKAAEYESNKITKGGGSSGILKNLLTKAMLAATVAAAVAAALKLLKDKINKL